MAKKLFLLLAIFVSVASLLWLPSPAPQVTAEFEVASIAHERSIPFKVTLKNHGTRTVEHLSVVARAGDTVESYSAPRLEPGEEKTMDGVLTVSTENEKTLFSARLIGENVSFRSPDIEVVLPDGLGGGEELLYSQQTQQVRQQDILPLKSAPNEPIQLGTGSENPNPDETAFGQLEPVEQTADVEHLISQVELHQCGASRRTLEVYQEMGNSEADQFLLASL